MADPTQKTRIAILDAHALSAECLCVALAVRGYEAIQVPVPVRTASSTGLVAVILRKRPDVVILDIELGTGWDAGTLVQGLARSGVVVVVVTDVCDPARWGEALAHGARLVLPKDAPLNAVTSAVRRLNDRVPLMTVDQRRGFLEAYRDESREGREQRARLETLTRRESEVLNYLMAGMTASDIARMCVVSEATVRTQIRAVLAKLEVSSQIAAVGVAHRVNWHLRELSKVDDRKRPRKLLTASIRSSPCQDDAAWSSASTSDARVAGPPPTPRAVLSGSGRSAGGRASARARRSPGRP